MKYSDYSKIVAFLDPGSKDRKAMLPDLPQKGRYALRRKIFSFSLCNQTVYCFGKVALHDVNATSTLQDLHENKLEHQGSVRLERTASSRFYLKSVRTHSLSSRKWCLQRLPSSSSDHDERRTDEAP